MKVKTSKVYVAFTGDTYDTKDKAEQAEIDYLEERNVLEWLVDYMDREGLSGRFRARIIHAITDYLINEGSYEKPE